MIFRLLLLLLAALLASCSSGEAKKETPPMMSQKMQDRIRSSRKRMMDPNDRSVYDKAMQASLAGRGKGTGRLGQTNFKTSSYLGAKSFDGTGNYKTSEYGGASQKSNLGEQSFAQAGKTASGTNSQFATSQSRYENASARDGAQVFSGADNVFETRSNRDALRSQRKNDRPKFIQLEEHSRTPAYSEDQVRSLLGRN